MSSAERDTTSGKKRRQSSSSSSRNADTISLRLGSSKGTKKDDKHKKRRSAKRKGQGKDQGKDKLPMLSVSEKPLSRSSPDLAPLPLSSGLRSPTGSLEAPKLASDMTHTKSVAMDLQGRPKRNHSLTSYTLPTQSVLNDALEKRTAGRKRPGVRRMTKEEEEALRTKAADRRDVGARSNAFRDRMPTSVTIDPMGFVPVAPRSSSGSVYGSTETIHGVCGEFLVMWPHALLEGSNSDDKRVLSTTKRLCIAFADTVGRRETMEDAMHIVGSFTFNDELDLVSLFDGHNGTACAQFLSQHFPRLLERSLKSLQNDYPMALVKLNERLKEKVIIGGSTALVALCSKDCLYIANIGDSRAVLVVDGKPVRITVDHRPDDPAERERIEKAGGTIVSRKTRDGRENLRVNGVLAVTRCFGDFEMGAVLSCTPDVFELEWSSLEQGPLVLACDGLFESLSDDEVAHIAHLHLKSLPGDVEGACRRLRDVAYARGSSDNISVIMLMPGAGQPPSSGTTVTPSSPARLTRHSPASSAHTTQW